MRWDSGRYRGTCFIELFNDPTVETIEVTSNIEK
jgi:hypothetical protein